jgi:nucleotide-binding universal stress UspA family protein
MIKRILVALGGTPFSASEIEHAVDLAKRHDAEITGVTVVDAERIEFVGPVPLGGAAAAHELREHRMNVTAERVQEAIDSFNNACAAARIRCRVVRETGDPFDDLISLWRYHDVTVSGLRGLFEYGVVHDPREKVEKLIGKGIRPILAVAQRPRPVRRALAAYNGSMASAKAIKHFVQLRPWPNASIEIVTCGLIDSEAGPLLRDAQEYCRAHGFDATIAELGGPPEDVLLAHADESGADLIILGASARGRLARWVVGDTALDMLTRSDLPLYLSH